MPAAKVVIVTPAPPGSRAGNRNTAVRWARILRDLGCRVSIQTEWGNSPCDLLIALHARKSHAALNAFRKSLPDRPAVLALTGTDIYRDIREDNVATKSLEIATRLIVLQKAALAELTAKQRNKAIVIHQSAVSSLHPHPPSRSFRICMLGHLREEKDPFRAALALSLLPGANITAIQAGQALSTRMERCAIKHMRLDSRYRWVGELPHWEAMRLLSRCHVMVISSWMEGGAHVVSEAIALGIPVIASDIPGNRGLLGDDYPGFFPAGNEARLADLLWSAKENPLFLDQLRKATKRRRALISPERERLSWRRLLSELLVMSPGTGRGSPRRSSKNPASG